MPLVHHELCFGCARANLFGLLLDVEPTAPGSVAGRRFIKQDHQGAEPGSAHVGILAVALSEATALSSGIEARAVSIEIELIGTAAVGEFVELEASVYTRSGTTLRAQASASSAGQTVARARGGFEPCSA